MKIMEGKVTLIYISLIVIGLVFASISYAKIDLETCAGAWLFDEGKGEIVKDLSKNGNDGTLMNGPKWVKGKFGSALEFDGVDDYIDCGNDSSFQVPDGEAFSYVVWIKPSSLSKTYQAIITHRQQAFSGSDKSLWTFNNDLYTEVYNDDRSSKAKGAAGVTLSVDTWYFVGLTRGTDGTVKIWLDGNPYIIGTCTGPITNMDTNLMIGRHVITEEQYFSGLIDEVAIFNVALNENDIKEIMTKGLLGASAVEPSGKLAIIWARIK